MSRNAAAADFDLGFDDAHLPRARAAGRRTLTSRLPASPNAIARAVARELTAPAPATLGSLPVTSPGDACEVDADRAAASMVAGQPTRVAAHAPTLSRWIDVTMASEARAYIASAPAPALNRLLAAIRSEQARPVAGSGMPVTLRVYGDPPFRSLDTRVMRDDLADLSCEVQTRIGQCGSRGVAAAPDAASGASPRTATPPAGAHDSHPASDRQPASTGDGHPPGYLPTAANVGGALISARDANLRIENYVRPAHELAERVFADYQAGRIDHLAGRTAAAQGRNSMLADTRRQLSPGARALSEVVRDEGQSLDALAERYARRLLHQDPTLRARYRITTMQPGRPGWNPAAVDAAIADLRNSPRVSEQIMQSAGRSNPIMTPIARTLRVVGPVVAAAGVVVSGYQIVTAPDGERTWTAGREVASFTGGTLGSAGGAMVGAWTASLVCGPAAPACAIAVSFVITSGAAYAGSQVASAGYEGAVPRDTFGRELEHPERWGPAVGGNAALGAGGGYAGAADRDRREQGELTRYRAPVGGSPPPIQSSGGEAWSPDHDAHPGPTCNDHEPDADE